MRGMIRTRGTSVGTRVIKSGKLEWECEETGCECGERRECGESGWECRKCRE